jgi:hypothetical protein
MFFDESLAAVVGAPVGLIAASDPDNPARTAGSGRPPVFIPPAWYALTFNLSTVLSSATRTPLFNVNASSGTIAVATATTWTVAQGQFWFQNQLVRATYPLNASLCDAGTPRLCAFAPVTIAVVSNYTAPPAPLIVSISLPPAGLGTLGGDTVSFQGMQLAVGVLTQATYCSNVTGLCFTSPACACPSAALITCTTMPGFGGGYLWNVTQRGVIVPSVSPLVTAYAPPVLASVTVTPSLPLTTAGGAVVLTGRNFGPPAALPFVVITVGPAASQFSMVPTLVNQSTMTAVLQPGCGAGLAVTVTVAGFQSSSANPAATAISFAPPTITSLSAAPTASYPLSQLATAGGDDVWIDGLSFGPLNVAGAPLAVSAAYTGGVGGYSYAYAAAACRKDDTSRAHSRVVCTTSPGVSANFTWTVSVCGQQSAPSTAVTSYAPPVLSRVSGPGAVDGSTDGGQPITVSGSSFGPLSSTQVPGQPPVLTYIAYGLPSGPRAWAYTPTCLVTGVVPATLSCLSAPGTGTNHSWRLAIGGQPSNVLYGVSGYGPPVISQFLGPEATAGATIGGGVVTLQARAE